ncbi:hypothetical protein LINGRAHAP2_LOCUS29375 [Linum grandiflorum]
MWLSGSADETTPYGPSNSDSSSQVRIVFRISTELPSNLTIRLLLLLALRGKRVTLKCSLGCWDL